MPRHLDDGDKRNILIPKHRMKRFRRLKLHKLQMRRRKNAKRIEEKRRKAFFRLLGRLNLLDHNPVIYENDPLQARPFKGITRTKSRHFSKGQFDE